MLLELKKTTLLRVMIHMLYSMKNVNTCRTKWWVLSRDTKVPTKVLSILGIGIKVGETDKVNREIKMANGETVIVKEKVIDIITAAQIHTYPLLRLMRLQFKQV